MRIVLALALLVAGGTQVIVRTPPAPIITSLSVTSGPVGTTVVLTGVHFGTTQGSGTVVFQSAVLATPTAWDDISITVTVPVGAVTGSVVVVQNGVTSNPITFTVAAGGTAQTCTGGTTYYVRTDGSNANTGKANTAAGAWLTITKGAQTAAAGDCVRVQPGTYVETVASPTNNGTAGNTITFVADGAVTTCGMTFSGKGYIRVIGLTMDHSVGGCSGNNIISFSGTSTGLEFWNDTVQNINNNAVLVDHAGNGALCHSCIWLGGSMTTIGNPGSATALHLAGNDDWVGYVNFSSICYIGIGQAGNRQRFYNNNFSGMIQCNATHPDFFYVPGNDTLGLSNMVWEAAFEIGTPTSSDNKVYHSQNDGAGGDWDDNILRFNITYNTGSASSHSLYTTSTANTLRWRMYQNDHLFGDRAVSGGNGLGCGGGSKATGNLTVYAYNSIYEQCWSDDNTTGIDPFQANYVFTAKDYNLAFSTLGTITFSSDWTSQAHPQTNVDPKLTNVSTHDFSLQSTSGARGVGGPLTTAVSCSGTTLNVASNTGTFFVGSNATNLPAYGGNLVPGDPLFLDGTAYTVVSVAADAITLNTTVGCANGDSVYYGTSATVDLGALPFKSGGYTLSATKALAGSTYTITPNDPSLVRFVVCYEASVPYAVVTSSPYTCSNPSGTFSALVYPKYASATQSVVAQ